MGPRQGVGLVMQIGVDNDAVERTVRDFTNLGNLTASHEFAFRDPEGVGALATDPFDRAFHEIAWKAAAAVSGAATELFDNAGAVLSATAELVDVDQEVRAQLAEAVAAFQFGALP